MKKLVGFFGPVLIIALLLEMIINISVIATLLFRSFFIAYAQYVYTLDNAILMSQLVEVGFYCTFVVGVFYILKGLYMIFLLQKDRSKAEKAKQELQRGTAGLLLAFLLWGLVGYIANYVIDNLLGR